MFTARYGLILYKEQIAFRLLKVKSGLPPSGFLNTILMDFPLTPSREIFTLLNFITLIMGSNYEDLPYALFPFFCGFLPFSFKYTSYPFFS